MIGLVTSTLFPSNSNSIRTNYRNLLKPGDRIAQTLETVRALRKYGIDNIWLLDNSDIKFTAEIKTIFHDINYIPINSLQFDNKGLSEIFMIRQGLDFLPDNVPIYKISGRYFPVDIEVFDIAEDIYVKKNGSDNISTRSYRVKNKEVFIRISDEVICYMLNYNSRIVGPGSLLRIIGNSLLQRNYFSAFHVNLMLESAFWRVVKNKFNFGLMEKLNISGSVCDNDGIRIIRE